MPSCTVLLTRGSGSTFPYVALVSVLSQQQKGCRARCHYTHCPVAGLALGCHCSSELQGGAQRSQLTPPKAKGWMAGTSWHCRFFFLRILGPGKSMERKAPGPSLFGQTCSGALTPQTTQLTVHTSVPKSPTILQERNLFDFDRNLFAKCI